MHFTDSDAGATSGVPVRLQDPRSGSFELAAVGLANFRLLGGRTESSASADAG